MSSVVFLVTDKIKFGFSFLASCLNIFFNLCWCLFVFIKRVLRETMNLVKGRSSLRRVLQMQLLISCLQLDVILTSRLERFLQELQRGWKQESVTCSWGFQAAGNCQVIKECLCVKGSLQSQKNLSVGLLVSCWLYTFFSCFSFKSQGFIYFPSFFSLVIVAAYTAWNWSSLIYDPSVARIKYPLEEGKNNPFIIKSTWTEVFNQS